MKVASMAAATAVVTVFQWATIVVAEWAVSLVASKVVLSANRWEGMLGLSLVGGKVGVLVDSRDDPSGLVKDYSRADSMGEWKACCEDQPSAEPWAVCWDVATVDTRVVG